MISVVGVTRWGMPVKKEATPPIPNYQSAQCMPIEFEGKNSPRILWATPSFLP